MLENREKLRQLKVEEIRRCIKAGRRSGVTLAEEEVFGPLEARYAATTERGQGGERPPGLLARCPRRPERD